LNAVIILSAVMAVLGCLGLWLAGRGGWSGWAINLAAQPAWAAFSVATHAWPLLASCVAYTIVFTGNWHRAWVRAGHRPLRLLTFRHRIKIVDPAPYLPKQNHYYRRPQQVGPFCQATPRSPSSGASSSSTTSSRSAGATNRPGTPPAVVSPRITAW
jgi:hypothetical protein